MVLRLASTAVQHQSPQLQPKQPSLHCCHFVAGLLSIFAGIFFSRPSPLPALLPDALQHFGCYVWWKRQPVMCDRMSWVEWVNQLFFLCQLRHMEPAMARHVSPQSGPCCSRSREGGQQRRFLSWSISQVSFRTTYMETCCFMLLPFAYGIQVVDWGLRLLRLSLLLSPFACLLRLSLS